MKEKKPDQFLKIGEVAQRTEVTLRTIRYYQSLGLIEAVRRTRGGVHLYGTEACDRIRFIRDMRSLDLPLATIREMLHQRRGAQTGAQGARGVAAALSRGLVEVEKRMQQFLVLRHQIGEALEVLETCLRCSLTPSREVCYACENLARRERVPTYIRAWVN